MARRIDLDQIIMTGTPGDFVIMTNTSTGVLETVNATTFKQRFDVGSGTGNISGSGTTGTIAKFTASGTVGDAAFLESEVVTTNTAQDITAAKTFAAGTLEAADIVDANSNEYLGFSSVASAVNYLEVGNAATGNVPTLTAAGDDANIGLLLDGKGTGLVQVGHGTADRVVASVDAALTDGNIVIGSDDSYNIADGGFAASDIARLSQSQTFTGIKTFGAGLLEVVDLAGSAADKYIVFTSDTTPVNYLSISNGDTTVAPIIAAAGSDTNIDLSLAGKGTGLVKADQGKGSGPLEVAVKSGAFTTGDLVQFNANGELVSAGAGSDLFVTLSGAQSISGTKTFTVAQNFGGTLNLSDGVGISGAGTHQIGATNALTLASSSASVAVTAATQLNLSAGSGNVVIDSTGGEIQLNTTISNDSGDMLIQPVGNLDLDAAQVEVIQGVINSGTGVDLVLDAGSEDIVVGGSRVTTADLATAGDTEDLALRTGDTSAGNSGQASLKSGDATDGNSGDVEVDVGTATGTNGVVRIGTYNASAISIGKNGVTTTNAGDMVVTGDLTVNGTTTTVNSTTLEVADKLITVASGSADGAAADGAGIEIDLGGGVGHSNNESMTWDNTNDNFTFTANVNIESGKDYKINNVSVLNATTLGSSVTTANGLTSASSLATVGTITSGTWNATEIGVVYGGTGLTAIAEHDVIYGSGTNTFSTASLDATSGNVLLGNVGSGVAAIDEAALLGGFKLYRQVERFTISNAVAADSGDLDDGTGSYFKLQYSPVDGKSITIRAVQGGYQNNKTVDGTDADFEYNFIGSEDRIYVANHSGDSVTGLGDGQIVNGDELEIEYFTTQP